jgi:hypothetical protein
MSSALGGRRLLAIPEDDAPICHLVHHELRDLVGEWSHRRDD